VWNSYLNEYLATYTRPQSDQVLYKTSPTLWGPWSQEAALFQGVVHAPGALADYAPHVHPEFAENNGQTQYVTYVVAGAGGPSLPAAGSLQLVRVQFKETPAPPTVAMLFGGGPIGCCAARN